MMVVWLLIVISGWCWNVIIMFCVVFLVNGFVR